MENRALYNNYIITKLLNRPSKLVKNCIMIIYQYYLIETLILPRDLARSFIKSKCKDKLQMDVNTLLSEGAS